MNFDVLRLTNAFEGATTFAKILVQRIREHPAIPSSSELEKPNMSKDIILTTISTFKFLLTIVKKESK